MHAHHAVAGVYDLNKETVLQGTLKKLKDAIFGGDAAAWLKVPYNDLPAEIRDVFMNGTKRRLTFRHGDYKFEREWKGALRAMRERIETPPSEKIKTALEELIAPIPCPVCRGARLQPESLAVKINGLGIADYTEMSIADASRSFDAIRLKERDQKIAGLVLKEKIGRAHV